MCQDDIAPDTSFVNHPSLARTLLITLSQRRFQSLLARSGCATMRPPRACARDPVPRPPHSSIGAVLQTVAAQTHCCIARSPHSQRTGSCHSVCARAFVAVFCTCCSDWVAVASRTVRVWRHKYSTNIARVKRPSSGPIFMSSVQVRVQIRIQVQVQAQVQVQVQIRSQVQVSGPGSFDFRAMSSSQVGCSGSDSSSGSGPVFIVSVLRGRALVSELL